MECSGENNSWSFSRYYLQFEDLHASKGEMGQAINKILREDIWSKVCEIFITVLCELSYLREELYELQRVWHEKDFFKIISRLF